MKDLICAAVGAALLGAVIPTLANNAQGVKVEEMSPFRKLVPEAELEATAAQQYTSITQQAGQKGILLPHSHLQVRRLRAIAQQLIPHAQRWNPNAARWLWEVNLIDSAEINAFCMPGGKIAFFTGILDTLKLTDDEVAIVMGHEIAHALREHGRERMAKSTLSNAGARLLSFGLSATLGIDPSITSTAAGLGANLAMLRFSRDDETEADVVGMDLVARAGFDPRAGVALWQKMARVNKGGGPQWLSTHPAGKSRIAEMQKHMSSALPLYAQAKGKKVSALPPYQTNVKGIGPIR